MIFADYESRRTLVNLNEFLEEWGISFRSNTYLRDYDHATSVDGITVIAEYVDKDSAEDGALGASLYADISELDSMPKTVCRYAMPVDILWKEGGGLTGTRQVFPVLKSYSSSEVRRGEETLSSGSETIMTLSRDQGHHKQRKLLLLRPCLRLGVVHLVGLSPLERLREFRDTALRNACNGQGENTYGYSV